LGISLIVKNIISYVVVPHGRGPFGLTVVSPNIAHAHKVHTLAIFRQKTPLELDSRLKPISVSLQLVNKNIHKHAQRVMVSVTPCHEFLGGEGVCQT
jgi:hypothetical protein